MEQVITVHLEKSVASAQLLEQLPDAEKTEPLELQKQQLEQLCQTLQEAVNKVNDSYKKIFSEHKEHVVRLSVEIARKILAQQQDQGQYQIESIIQEALKQAPSLENVTIYLNPDDHANWEKTQQQGSGSISEQLNLVADADIGPAECRIETPKGVIESVIEKHLERIEEALKKA